MKTKTKGLTLTLVALLLPAALLTASRASAQTAPTQSVVYCCNDSEGRKFCSDFLPKECQKRAYEERDSKGFVIKKVDAPLTAEQQARRDAELAKKTELAQKQLEERRRNQALLSTYSSEQDIDKARDRALADADKAISQAEKAQADAVKQQKVAEKETEFYKGKPLPAPLKKQIEAAEKDIATKNAALEKRKQDRERIVTDYENEKVRFRELSGGKTGVKVDEKPKREVIIQGPAVASTPPPAETPAVAPAAAPAATAAPAAKPAEPGEPKKN